MPKFALVGMLHLEWSDLDTCDADLQRYAGRLTSHYPDTKANLCDFGKIRDMVETRDPSNNVRNRRAAPFG